MSAFNALAFSDAFYSEIPGNIITSGNWAQSQTATVLPQNDNLMAIWGYRTNNATALAVAIDIMSEYIETDL